MKSGFSLIEILVAVAISSIVAWTLFFSFSQTQKSADLIEQMLSIDPKIMTLSNQFEKDITGVFVPKYWFPKEESKESDNKQSEKKEESKKDLNSKPGQRIPVKKEEYKKIDKVFFSSNEQSNLKEITFITCNPLQTYNNYKPRIVRILYKLVPDEENKNSYKLLRKESLNLDFAKINEEKNIEYELASGIKSLSLSFIYPEEEKKDSKEEAKKTEEKNKKEIKYKTLEIWNKDENKDVPDIPQYVVLKVSLWDLSLQEDYNFEIIYQIFAFSQEEEHSEKKEQELKTDKDGQQSVDSNLKSEKQDKTGNLNVQAKSSAFTTNANQKPGLGNLIR